MFPEVNQSMKGKTQPIVQSTFALPCIMHYVCRCPVPNQNLILIDASTTPKRFPIAISNFSNKDVNQSTLYPPSNITNAEQVGIFFALPHCGINSIPPYLLFPIHTGNNLLTPIQTHFAYKHFI